MNSNFIQILLLEDQPDDAELIKLELEKADLNFELLYAVDKDSFVKHLSDSKPDIILSDFNLPDFDIFRAMDLLREYNINAPFILVTGALGDEHAVDLIVNHGVCDYILKSNLGRLNPAVEREIEKIWIQREVAAYKEDIKKLSLVASHTHNGVIISDEEGRIEWVNKAYERITGYTLKESIGKIPGHILQGPNTNPNTVKRIGKLLKKKVHFTEEILNYRKSGESYWIKLDISPVKDENGDVVQFIAIQEDITNRKKAEDELLFSYRQLQRSQEIGEIGSWTYDIESNEIYWSDQMFKIYNRDQNLGPPSFSDIMEMTNRKGPNNTSKLIKAAIKEGTPYDVTIQITNGESKYVRAIGIPTRDKYDKVTGLEGTVQDVTDIKIAENKLSETTKQLQDIANNIDGVLHQYALYPDGTDELLFVSDGIKNIFGITKEQAIKNIDLIYDGVAKDQLSELRVSIQKSANTLKPWHYSWKHNLPDGTIRYVQGRGTPSKMENGTVIWNTVVLDVTDQVMAEQKEQELQKLLQGTLNEIYIYDAESLKFVYCNNAAEQNTGYSLQELQHLTPLDLKVNLNQKQFNSLLDEVDHKNSHYFETLHRRKDGSTYHILAQIKSEIYQTKKVYVANIIDITDRAEALDSLKETNKKLRNLIEAAPIGIYLIDTDGIIIDFWNPAAEQIFGFTKEEVMGRFIPSIDKTQMKEYWEIIDRIKKGRAISSLRLKRKRKNGEIIIIELNASAVYKEGELYQILVLVQDITELVNKESQLKQALQDKNVLIQEIHHRVKNNLAIVSGLIELQILRGDVHPQLIETKNRIMSIASVHEQLYETDKFSDVNVKNYFNSLILKSKNSFMDEHQKIDIIFDSNIEKLNINEAIPLGLLMNELITNSVRHAFNGQGGNINISLLDDTEDTLQFRYSDSGRGFEKSKFEKNEGFGLELIKTLITQLTNQYKLDTDNRFNLEFKFQRKHRGSYSNLN